MSGIGAVADWQALALQLSGNLDRLLNAQLRVGSHSDSRSLIAEAEAEAIYQNRRARDRMLDEQGLPQLFGEPAWDMLLDLYIAKAKNREISVTSLCLAGCVPGTTGLRWIGLLEAHRLVMRRSDASDGRRTFVELTELGLVTMTRLLCKRSL